MTKYPGTSQQGFSAKINGEVIAARFDAETYESFQSTMERLLTNHPTLTQNGIIRASFMYLFSQPHALKEVVEIAKQISRKTATTKKPRRQDRVAS